MNDDPTDDPAYQAWLADLATQCRCSHDRPCAGLMAGGFCDELDWSEDDYEIDFDDDLEPRGSAPSNPVEHPFDPSP